MKDEKENTYGHDSFHKEREKIDFIDDYISNVFFNSKETKVRRESALTLSMKYVKNCNLKEEELSNSEKEIMDEAVDAWKKAKDSI